MSWCKQGIRYWQRKDYEVLEELKVKYRNGGQVTHNYLKRIKKAVRQEIFKYLDKLPVNVELTVNGGQYILKPNGVETRDGCSQNIRT